MADLPDFEKLWNAYPQGSADEIKKLIGGGVAGDWVTNTCAIRMSRAFNYADNPIPKGHKLPDGSKLNTTFGGDKKRYAFRVAEFRKYLEELYGEPELKHDNSGDGGPIPDEFKKRKGIIVFEVKVWSDATGHIDLWDGESCAGDAYFNKARQVALWAHPKEEEEKPFIPPWEFAFRAWTQTSNGGPP